MIPGAPTGPHGGKKGDLGEKALLTPEAAVRILAGQHLTAPFFRRHFRRYSILATLSDGKAAATACFHFLKYSSNTRCCLLATVQASSPRKTSGNGGSVAWSPGNGSGVFSKEDVVKRSSRAPNHFFSLRVARFPDYGRRAFSKENVVRCKRRKVVKSFIVGSQFLGAPVTSLSLFGLLR
ncbi:hypothetical protein NDU88_005562 [Pleurodeles waltl]|uniref:Uncharacterized protein n=1 Tax=Pleurodeles waltl TaxID=8319 RepID=A0AAV7WAT8_PLEWA|nr:hypothetical protein NDU88_005562 [Pleurodeles waltl]